MLPAYQNASGESGSGTFVRMKDHVTNHTAAKKKVMFHSASQSLKNQLMKLQVRFFDAWCWSKKYSFNWTLHHVGSFTLTNTDTHHMYFTLSVQKSVSLKTPHTEYPFKRLRIHVDVGVDVNEP